MKLFQAFVWVALQSFASFACAFPANGVSSFRTPEEACAAWAKGSKGKVTTRDTGHGNVGCTVKDGENVNSQESVGQANCPLHAHPKTMRSCECNEGYTYRDNACVDKAAAPVGDESARSTAQGGTRTASVRSEASAADNCHLARLKGSALRARVVALITNYKDEANQQLIERPKESAKSVPSVGKGFFTGDYGTLLEHLVAKRVQADACLSKFVRHLSAVEQSKRGAEGEKGSHPDFQGVGESLRGLQIDITTEEQKAKKLATDGAKADYVFVIYERGLCLDAKSRVAVKIQQGADRTKIKNGICPENWR